jgi:outer membrane protein TolC
MLERRKIKYGLMGAMFLVGQFAFAQQNNAIVIDSCYAMAKRNYPVIKQFTLIEKSKEFTISNANKAYLPQISITGIGGYIGGLPNLSAPGSEPAGNQHFKFIGIGQINQTIWDGGATRVQKNMAQASADVDNASTETALFALQERVDQIFFGILLIDAQMNQLNVLQENLNRMLNKVKLSKENGMAYQSDVDEVNAEIMLVDQKKIEFGFARAGYVQMLSHLVGKSLPDNIILQPPSITEPVAFSNSNRPELKMYSNQRRLLETQSSINKVYNMPKVGLLGYGVMIQPGASLGSSTLSSLFVGGLSVSWNSANLYKTGNTKQLDKIQIDRINNQEEVFVFNNNLQLKQASSEISKQKAIVSKDIEIIALKEKITKSYQLKYDNGLCSMNDLVTSVYKESEARNNQALHSVQLLLSQYNYKTLSGN